ncbi:hypothetical protein [Elizabethkingia anophelis]|uniref:hypothetical protein n=1 Tax=Elizabethkingia anophelis TaxID=1117645 RepID=UPI000D0361D2|nr:hypothetical protein [Elizabethkingia anophelis]MDV4044705.1 hypothetical protein [Elizabethkingia anophelis]PRQ86603.1 hypothetical protein CMT87_01330 [Elizabethkingia anophelis]PRQ88084.1 hypothetical protein CMT86_06270 [Elizabethkingia anophelis]
MKQLIFTIIVLVACLPKEPQGCTTDFSIHSDQEYKNIVETSPINGEKYFISSSKRGFFIDTSQFDLDRGGYFVFYKVDNQLYMANVSGKWGQQSYGKVVQLSKKVEETNISTFKWYYHNSYNNKSGVATITLIKTYAPEETRFNLQMNYSGLKVSYGGIVDVF